MFTIYTCQNIVSSSIVVFFFFVLCQREKFSLRCIAIFNFVLPVWWYCELAQLRFLLIILTFKLKYCCVRFSQAKFYTQRQLYDGIGRCGALSFSDPKMNYIIIWPTLQSCYNMHIYIQKINIIDIIQQHRTNKETY